MPAVQETKPSVGDSGAGRARPNGLRPPSKPSHAGRLFSCPSRVAAAACSTAWTTPSGPSRRARPRLIRSIAQLHRVRSHGRGREGRAGRRVATTRRPSRGSSRSATTSAPRQQPGRDRPGIEEAVEALGSIKVGFDHERLSPGLSHPRGHERSRAGQASRTSHLAQLGPYIDSGPRSDQEAGVVPRSRRAALGSGGDRQVARTGACTGVLRLEPEERRGRADAAHLGSRGRARRRLSRRGPRSSAQFEKFWIAQTRAVRRSAQKPHATRVCARVRHVEVVAVFARTARPAPRPTSAGGSVRGDAVLAGVTRALVLARGHPGHADAHRRNPAVRDPRPCRRTLRASSAHDSPSVQRASGPQALALGAQLVDPVHAVLRGVTSAWQIGRRTARDGLGERPGVAVRGQAPAGSRVGVPAGARVGVPAGSRVGVPAGSRVGVAARPCVAASAAVVLSRDAPRTAHETRREHPCHPPSHRDQHRPEPRCYARTRDRPHRPHASSEQGGGGHTGLEGSVVRALECAARGHAGGGAGAPRAGRARRQVLGRRGALQDARHPNVLDAAAGGARLPRDETCARTSPTRIVPASTSSRSRPRAGSRSRSRARCGGCPTSTPR